MKLALLGCGKMGSALLKGILNKGHVLPTDVTLSDPHAPSATALAARLQSEAPADPARIARAYELLYARPPTAPETALGLAYLADPADPAAAKPETRWKSYAQALLSAHEFRQIQ